MLNRDNREITVSAYANSDEETFRVTIRDTGVGIIPEHLKKVFNEKFTTKEKGHGFGLVVCKRIIESHNGHLIIESTPDVGTAISIDFPLTRSASEPSVCENEDAADVAPADIG